VRLSDVAEVQLGKMLSPAAKTGEHYHPYLRAANIKHGEIDFIDVLEMDFDPVEYSKFAVRPGDIILVEGGEIGDVGDSALYTDEMPRDMALQKTLVRVRIESGETHPEFLFQALRDLHSNGGFQQIAMGTKMKHITAIRTSNLKLSLPTIGEQREIVGQVRQAEASVEALRHHGERTQRLKRSLLNTELAPSDHLAETHA
jgi:type I restriction enzyme S subunit